MKQYINNLSHSFNSMFLSLVMWREKHVKERTFVIDRKSTRLNSSHS